jgi:predicted tellurium resistance membrane protein TerC
MMIFRRNNLQIGIGLSLILVILVFSILNGITQIASLAFKIRTLALISICFNMLLVRQFRKNRAGESIRGVVLTTVGLSVLWIVWFGAEIYNEL